ncbi:hypothetical protein ZOD2009_17048 [Haladaptatus paucihalophilus DX253]|uniref:Uncharacterized protein n=1 Tax=Haladaptatus paucihalophilus DX253 TaxID=797209 RepID=E7QX71_HALPU|nr:hypothetical protein [Haladaptatus paucihalophilus]EFW90874.1 hypothetical protein ZOD2009_17048 [Haladaptatus paucihalophilus DX253]SHK24621.1 hypothetical protein SAMN05444342_1090 [Haladaptatus paucihalophilus DX253]
MSENDRISGAGVNRIGSPSDEDISAFGLLEGSVRDLRTRPSLALPFLLIGIVLAALNLVRLRDSVPVQLETIGRYGVAHLTVLSHPGSVQLVTRPVGAVFGLRLLPVAGIAAVWLASLTATAAAVTAVVALVDGDSVSPRDVASVTAYLAGLLAVLSLVAATGAAFGFVGKLAAFLAFVFVSVRLFPAPVLVARGASIRNAVRRSSAAVSGHGVSVLGFSVLVGTFQFWLGSLPLLDAPSTSLSLRVALGTFLAVAVFAPLATLGAVRVAALASDE